MSQTEAQITSIELNRVLFKLQNAKTPEERLQLTKIAHWLKGKISEYQKPTKSSIKILQKQSVR